MFYDLPGLHLDIPICTIPTGGRPRVAQKGVGMQDNHRVLECTNCDDKFYCLACKSWVEKNHSKHKVNAFENIGGLWEWFCSQECSDTFSQKVA